MRNLLAPNPKLHRRIQSGLLALGLELRRIPKPTRSDKQAETPSPSRSRFTVELMGASGIGKSAFLEYLQETESAEDEFTALKRKLRLQRRSVLIKRWDRSDQLWLELWKCHRELEDLHNVHPGGFAADEAKVLRDEKTIRSFTSFRPLVIDHSLAFYFKRALELWAADHSDLFDEIMRDRAVIVCRADPSLLVERIHRRAQSGVIRAYHLGRSDEELLEHCRKEVDYWNEYGEMLSSKGIPVLVLDLDRPLEESKLRLKQFANSLS